MKLQDDEYDANLDESVMDSNEEDDANEDDLTEEDYEDRPSAFSAEEDVKNEDNTYLFEFALGIGDGLANEMISRGNLQNIAERDLRRLYDAYKQVLKRVCLSVDEAEIICEVVKNKFYSAASVRNLRKDVEDYVVANTDENPYLSSVCKDLLPKLKSLSSFERLAIVDAAERYWETIKEQKNGLLTEVFGCPIKKHDYHAHTGEIPF